jgi:dihydroxy-acid dehydratase
MREMHVVTSILVGMGLDTTTALITDGRFSGSTRGPAIGHISPEAAEGGPIAVVKDGDLVSYDIPKRRLDVELSDAELKARLSRWMPPARERRGYLGRYAKMVSSGDMGAILF